MYVLNLVEIVRVLVVSPALPTDIDIQTRTMILLSQGTPNGYFHTHLEFNLVNDHYTFSILITYGENIKTDIVLMLIKCNRARVCNMRGLCIYLTGRHCSL